MVVSMRNMMLCIAQDEVRENGLQNKRRFLRFREGARRVS